MFDLKQSLAAGVAIILMVGTPAAAPGDTASPVVHAGLSAPAKAWGAAMETGDLAAFARMHGPETIAFPPGQTLVKGDTAIMKGYADLFAGYSVRVTTDDAHWIESGPLVVSWGLTTLTLHPKAGGPDVVSHTRFTDAAIAVDGGWRYVVDHASKPASR